MNILILSRKRQLYSTRRLVEECERLGYEPRVIDPLRFTISISGGKPVILHHGKELTGADVVIPRVGSYGTLYAICVVRHFDMMGIPVVNGHLPISQAKNKLASLQLLANAGVPVPDTIMSRYPKYLDKIMKLIGGPPAILKLLRGTQGTGVIYSESAQSVESVLDTIWSLGEDILLQQYVAESKGTDIRVLVIDGEARAAMRRIPKKGEFRSNIHRGGKGVKVDIPEKHRRIAVRAAAAIGLNVAGVDMIESDNGPLVIEVNSSPGFEGLEKATGENAARMIIEYAAKRAARKE
ncbi:MAG: hypothetical protein A2Z34_10910 [Planctomycetes bacterium RBG_16_59_8]|nr:MAG: hypothetical protein A2Z34_10910 [Planctomycetes bacterium RBG_16_59_8]